MDKSRKGKVCAVWSMPVFPAPTPRVSTATRGAAARPTCSADCAARFDQARRLNADGSRADDFEPPVDFELMNTRPFP